MVNCDFKKSKIEIQNQGCDLYVPGNVTACENVITGNLCEKEENGNINVKGDLCFPEHGNKCMIFPFTTVTPVSPEETMSSRTIATYKNENAVDVDINETVTSISNTDSTGNPIADYHPESGPAQPIYETITSISNTDSTAGHPIADYHPESGPAQPIYETVTLFNTVVNASELSSVNYQSENGTQKLTINWTQKTITITNVYSIKK